MEERDFEAVLGEFLPDEEEMERQIREEMDRLYDEQGGKLMMGEAAESLHRRWLRTYGFEFFGALRRKGLIAEDEEE